MQSESSKFALILFDQIPNRRVDGTDRNAIFWYFSSIRLCLTLLFIISIQGKVRGLKLSVCMHVCNFWKKNVSLMSIPCTAKYSLCYLTYLCTYSHDMYFRKWKSQFLQSLIWLTIRITWRGELSMRLWTYLLTMLQSFYCQEFWGLVLELINLSQNISCRS